MGNKARIIVWFSNRQYPLLVLADKFGFNRRNAIARYHRAGCPDRIFRWFFCSRIEWQARMSGKYDNEQVGVGDDSSSPGQHKQEEDRSLGWAERKYFPDTGNRGCGSLKTSERCTLS